jgi:hypothetical protein
MKRNIGIAIGALILGGMAVLLPQALQSPRPLADLIPAGALVYVQAKDLAALVNEWNASPAKAAWLASDNYRAFARSRLFMRFEGAQSEFAAGAGLNPDMSLVAAVAGTDSALALYDIGELEFLYITRMPSARAYQTMLWQSRAKFQPRQSAGIDYYAREQQRRTAAFAVTNDLMLVATNEQQIASALALIAGRSSPAMKQEPWYQRATAAQPTAGEIRMVLNFERVLQTPHFRSYWIQRNVRDLKQFNAVISDLDRSASEYRECRVLLRAEAGTDLRPAEAAVAEVSRYAPNEAGLYRAWVKPDTAAVVGMIQDQILAPRTTPERDTRMAPAAGDMDAASGSEQDLETRIDEAPFADDSGKIELQPLHDLLRANVVQAVLEVEGGRVATDGIFVTTTAAIVLLGERPWDLAAARAALEDIPVATAGRALIIANDAALATTIAGRSSVPAATGAAYAMRFLHATELPRFERMTRMIDQTSLRETPGNEREPLFFSENLASLGRTLGRINSVSLESHDDGTAVRQTVVYGLR